MHVDQEADHLGGGHQGSADGAYVRRPSVEKTVESVIDTASDCIACDACHARDDDLSPEEQSYLESLLDDPSDSP